MRRLPLCISWLAAFCLSSSAQTPPADAPLPPVTAPFRIHQIAQGIGGGYQTVAIDVNHDGKTDIIALGLSADTLTWYENPTWTPHVITTTATTPKMVIMDAADVDGDGIPEIALAFDFNANPTLSVGSIGILHHDGDPARPWTLERVVDHVPAAHRLRFVDVDGSGKRALIAAPILNELATGFPDPEHRVTPLFMYRPETGWRRETVTLENHGVVHGLFSYDWFGDGHDDPMTAGYSGIAVHELKNGSWQRTLLSPGLEAPWPGGGASDVAVGKLNGRQFFVSIEPFHGNMVVVYTQDGKGGWDRHVIDTGLTTGHALTLVDVDGDGIPEIVAGGNRTATNLFFYKATDATGHNWTRMQMDDAMAPASCVAADIAGHGKHDVVCMEARAPFRLKWYEYTGK